MHDNYDMDQLMELVQERKFRALREILAEMNEVDIAEFLDELEVEQELLVFRLLPKALAAEVFSYLEEDQEKLIGALSDKELREVLDELYMDDTVDLIEDPCPPTWSAASCATPTPPPAARSTSCSTTPRTPPGR